jgi:hypothetical protein
MAEINRNAHTFMNRIADLPIIRLGVKAMPEGENPGGNTGIFREWTIEVGGLGSPRY